MSNSSPEFDAGSNAFQHGQRVRLAMLRHLAAAHALAGVIELLRFGLNLALRLPYTGGPMGILGALTVAIAQCLYSLSLGSGLAPTDFWFRSNWIRTTATANHDFFVAMMGAHLAIGFLNLIVGHGLWHRRRWGWWADVCVISLAGFLAIAHLIALLMSPGMPMFLLAPVLVSVFVAVLILPFLLSRKTRTLFTNQELMEQPAIPQRRPWWLLSLQWLGALLAVILAVGIVLLFSLGPMVEIVWFSANLALSWIG